MAKARMADLQAEAAANRLAGQAASKRSRSARTTVPGLGSVLNRLVLVATTRRLSALRSGSADCM
jgi:hypothetical protein